VHQISSHSPTHAVVIGGSVAGLMAARVLANHFGRVTLFEGDAEVDGHLPRKGVPQGHQFHALLTSGLSLLEDYFPGFIEGMIAEGVAPVDFPEDVRWFQFGSWKSRAPCGMRIYPEGRVRLEGRIRARVRGHPGVRIETGSRVEGLEFEKGNGRVSGVRLRCEGGAQTVAADLVVDASGRGSQCVKWLEAMGYAAPARETLEVDMVSVTRVFWKTEAERDWEVLGVHPMPGLARGGHVFPLDARRWIVTLFGYAGHHPPADPGGFLEFARGLPSPDLSEAIARAGPASGVARSRYFKQTRLRLDRVKRFPKGVLVMGDAMCSFDPVFGQGMTVACKEARALDEVLAGAGRKFGAPLWKAYFRRCGRILDVPWTLSVCEGLRFESMRGPRTLKVRLLQWYTAHVFCLSAAEAGIYRTFLKVLHLEASPVILFSPAIFGRVIWRALLGRRAVPPGGNPAFCPRARHVPPASP
jgi:flavin-dependent dehydrogenase